MFKARFKVNEDSRGKSNRQIVGSPGNDFINRVQGHLSMLCRYRAIENSDINVSFDFEKRLIILYGEMHPYITEDNEQIIHTDVKKLKCISWDFSFKKLWGGKYQIEYTSGNSLLYIKKWELMDKIEYALRGCIRRNNFDVQESEKRRRPN